MRQKKKDLKRRNDLPEIFALITMVIIVVLICFGGFKILDFLMRMFVRFIVSNGA